MNLNRAEIIGHVGGVPELRRTKGGTAVANLSVATNRRWTGSDGKPVERTDWHSVVLWKKVADWAAQNLPKGALVFISGELRTDKWTDDKGVERWSTKIHAAQLLWLNRPRQVTDRDAPPPTDDDAPPPAGDDDIPF